MKVETLRFGTVEINDGSIIRMPRGPFGFENHLEFCLIQHRPDTKFRWLQSVSEPALAFVVIDPAEFFTGYEIEISDADAEKLNLKSADDALVLTIVTIGNGGKDVTANLAAPIVINSNELIGMQVVLQDQSYSVKQPLVLVDNSEEQTEIKKSTKSEKKEKVKAA
ncbi:MAG: flagellar assembly protein FliW [Armatimonadota bacterium]